jgi:predicted lactoylglutathione lyase
MPGITQRRNAVAGGVAAALIVLAGCSSSPTDGPTGSAGAAPAASPAVPGGTLGLGITGLIVKDIPASLAFYRRLGLAIPQDVDTSGGAVRFRLPNDTVFVWETVQYTQQGFDGSYRPTGTGDGDRKVTLEFGFSSAADVDAVYDKLVSAGAASYQTPLTWNNGTIRFAMVVDPDNNKIGLRWPLAS